MSGKTTLVWYRRDLRLSDNPALAAAVADSDRVVPVYVHAPEEESPWSPGAATRWWLHHSLAALDAALRQKGTALALRQGPALPALVELAHAVGATKVVWNRLYDPAIVARDTAIKAGLRDLGFECESHNGSLLHEPWEIRTGQGGPYRVFTPYWRACQTGLAAQPMPVPAPARLHGLSTPAGGPTLDELNLLPKIPWDAAFSRFWTPGEDGAHRRLEEFCGEWLGRYDQGRDRPDLPASSRLSPHLHFGEVSPRQCLFAARNAVIDQPQAAKSADSFIREIGWREFAHHLLHHYPHTPEHPLDARFERFPWRENDDLLRAWQQGRTGFPIVDAGLRELWTSGFMHNRVRMIVASLLTKNLQQPWLAGARWFWDTLVDADLAANTLGWQWTAGCGADAAPFFRIFNPVLQAERFDPQRVYLRRWLPELAALPDAWIHRPWLAPAGVLEAAGVTLGRTYPAPVVDFPASRESALAAYRTIRDPGPPEVR
jgi:deoxyribodipyrimidine photo-lyase